MGRGGKDNEISSAIALVSNLKPDSELADLEAAARSARIDLYDKAVSKEVIPILKQQAYSNHDAEMKRLKNEGKPALVAHAFCSCGYRSLTISGNNATYLCSILREYQTKLTTRLFKQANNDNSEK